MSSKVHAIVACAILQLILQY